LPGGTEENNKKKSLRIADDPAGIPTKHFPSVNVDLNPGTYVDFKVMRMLYKQRLLDNQNGFN